MTCSAMNCACCWSCLDVEALYLGCLCEPKETFVFEIDVYLQPLPTYVDMVALYFEHS